MLIKLSLVPIHSHFELHKESESVRHIMSDNGSYCIYHIIYIYIYNFICNDIIIFIYMMLQFKDYIIIRHYDIVVYLIKAT
jgi:hypothetical protein